MHDLPSSPEHRFSRQYINKPRFIFGQLLIWGIFQLLLLNPVYAEQFQTIIKSAEITLEGDLYVLEAEIDFQLSSAAKDALLKGIPLTWDIPIRVKQRRSLIWNKEIVSLNLRYQIRYYALMNIYRVKSEHNNQINNYSSLSAAINSFSLLKEVPLLKRSELSPKDHYFVEFQASFDRNKLPIPLRPLTYFDSEWFLSSDWFVCSLPK